MSAEKPDMYMVEFELEFIGGYWRKPTQDRDEAERWAAEVKGTVVPLYRHPPKTPEALTTKPEK